MKHCPYCNIDYEISESRCPSCNATDSEIKCDNCATIHRGKVCPNCGFGSNDTIQHCPKCGNKTNERICPKCGHDIASTSTIKEAAASVVSKVSCKIVGHNWLGCKCTRCGEIQDKGHTFQPVAGKCEQRCSVCGKIEKLPHQWQGEQCVRCGATRKFGNINKSTMSRPILDFFLVLFTGGLWLIWMLIRYFRNRDGDAKDSDKKKSSGLTPGLIALSALVIIMASQGLNPNKNDEIRVPSSSATFEGQDYRDVVHELQKAGFTNIETKSLEDLTTGWIKTEGSVKEVEVDGYPNYSTSERYPKDVEIVVSYHSFPPK